MVSKLRKTSNGSQVPWTIAELRSGFEHFKALHSRYPTAHEIDAFPFLPSSRSIQRAFGGLVSLREKLFPDETISNFTKGEHRSKVAKRTFANGRTYEARFYTDLLEHFTEIAVHEHKLIRPGNVSCDFFIYLNETQGVVIDIFYAESILNLINVVNIKLKRYALVVPETYLVLVGNEKIVQTEIEAKIQNRKLPIPTHVHVVTEDYFKTEIIPDILLRSKFAK